ncbi:MAG: hypothetical protein WBA16_11855 [Nonlabens sp.]
MKLLKNLSLLAAIIYFALSVIQVLFVMDAPRGDELYFVPDLQYTLENGLWDAIRRNVSIPFTIVHYFPFKFFGLPGVKVVNLLLSLLFIFYAFKKTGVIDHLKYLLFYMATVLYFFTGSNDAIFSLSLGIFFIETICIFTNKKGNLALAISALIVAAFTRELIIVFLPFIALSLFLVRKTLFDQWRKMAVPALLFCVLLALNIPSIQENSTLSYDRKKPPATTSSNWVQRQHLSQLLYDSGELKPGTHVSWDEVDIYLADNGQDALPSTSFEGMFFDIELTIKEFFIDLQSATFRTVRQIGVVYLLFAAILFIAFRQRKPDIIVLFKLGLLAAGLCLFSFFIISTVELRWMAPILLLNVVVLRKDFKLNPKLISLNNALMLLLTIYGCYKIILRMEVTSLV